jgi:hypothetical protein
LNILAPLGRKSGDPGLYLDVMNSSCSIASCRWSPEGIGTGDVGVAAVAAFHGELGSGSHAEQ